MGTTNHKSSFPSREPISYSFILKPFKLTLDSNPSKCKCQNVTNGNIEILSPKPRSGHRIVCNDINMYSFGGYNPSLSPSDEEDLASDAVWSESKPLFKELWKYNISMKSWTKLNVEEIPDILASNAVILSGQLLMVYGGTGVPFGANCSNDLFLCDLRNDNEHLRFNVASTSGNCPPPQYGQTIVLVNNYLYTIGGTTGYEYTCDIHRLNVRDGIWEDVYTCTGADTEPPGRYRHETAFDGNRIYVLGGGTAREAFDFEVIFAFNLSTKRWEKIVTSPDTTLSTQTYPTPRRCHSSVQYDQHAYIIGGFSGRSILKDIWKLNLNTMEWKKFRNFALDRGAYFHSSCVTSSGKLITFGGIIPSDTTSLRSASVHTAWLCVPKLKDICWEAVTFYQPNLYTFSEKELLSLGLPFEYIRRLDLRK